jgi:hypothetical protein
MPDLCNIDKAPLEPDDFEEMVAALLKVDPEEITTMTGVHITGRQRQAPRCLTYRISMVSNIDMTLRAPGRPEPRPVWFLRWVATLVMVGGIAASAVMLTLGATGAGGDQVTTTATVAREEVVDLPDGVSVASPPRITAEIDDASRTERRLAALRFIPILIVIVALAGLLRGVLGTIRTGDPFVTTNVRRLRALAVVLLFGVPFATVLTSLGDQALARSAGLTGAGLGVSFPIGSLLGGLGTLVLAEVFAAGSRMREDLERII